MKPELSMESLRKIDLFDGLTDEELSEVRKLCSEHYKGTGELCVSEGDRVEHIHFVKRGKVAIAIRTPKSADDKTVIEILEDGEVFAWSAMVTSTLTASVTALEPTEVLDINARDLLELCEKRPRLGYMLMKNLTLVINSRLTKSRGKLGAAYGELKESQEQLIQAEKLSSLGQMAASIAHEVNNPLAGVLNYTKLLNKKINDGSLSSETASNYLSKMEAELTRSSRLIKNLLDFARQSPPYFRDFNINDVIERTLELVTHSAQLQNIQITKHLNLSLPKIVADFDQLMQVCTNIFMNSIQAMSQGGMLTISTSAYNNQIKIEIKDTGCGIPEENMHKLFTPFFTTKHEVKGVGLGLAISYGIIQRHKGKIEVQSQVGQGTTFIIYLPLHQEQS